MLLWALIVGAIGAQKLEFERKKVHWNSGFDKNHEVNMN